MEETKTSCDNVVAEKIKAFDPHIVVNKADIEPYYMIRYYDAADKKWHLGYGSFNLSFVREWLRDEFEEVEVEFAEVVRCGKCKHFYADTYNGKVLRRECRLRSVGGGIGSVTLESENDFCSYGERKEENDNR